MAPLAPPLTRPLVLSKAKHCQAVLSKAKHWHAVMSEVPFKTSTPFKFKKKNKKIKKDGLMLSQTVNKCPGWNHEIAIEWRSKNFVRFKLGGSEPCMDLNFDGSTDKCGPFVE